MASGMAPMPNCRVAPLGHQFGDPLADRSGHASVGTGAGARAAGRRPRWHSRPRPGRRAVAVRVAASPVDLGDDQSTAAPRRLDRGRQDVHLDAQAHRAVDRPRGVQHHDVRRQALAQQLGQQRQPAREVGETGPAAHRRPDERGLEVTPSRSGMPGWALSMCNRYSATAPSSTRSAAAGAARFPLATTRGTPGSRLRIAARPVSENMRIRTATDPAHRSRGHAAHGAAFRVGSLPGSAGDSTTGSPSSPRHRSSDVPTAAGPGRRARPPRAVPVTACTSRPRARRGSRAITAGTPMAR